MEPSAQVESNIEPRAEDLVEFEHHEIIDGVLVRKASPAAGHAHIQGELLVHLRDQSVLRGGGWRFFIEPIVELAGHQVYLPDFAGWRRRLLHQLATPLPDPLAAPAATPPPPRP
jgi:Uma2 family endonuclease